MRTTRAAGLLMALCLAAPAMVRGATELLLTDDPCRFSICPALPLPPPLPRAGEPHRFYLVAATADIPEVLFADTVALSSIPPVAGLPGSHTFVPADRGVWFFDVVFPSGGPRGLRAVTTSGAFLEVELRLEVLPSREQPTFAITSFPVTGGEVRGLTPGPFDGRVWYTALDAQVGPAKPGSVGSLDSAGAVVEFPLAVSSPGGIVAGSDGNLWYAAAGNGGTSFGQIARITRLGVTTLFPVQADRSAPQDVALGFDGNVWFTDAAGAVGRITPAGQITRFAVPTPGAVPVRICRGADGALWFSEYGAGQIGRIDSVGNVTEFRLSDPKSRPWGVALGPDGRVWFTELGSSRIGSITAGGFVQELELPAGTSGYGIGRAADGALWAGTSIGLLRIVPGDFSHETVLQGFSLPPGTAAVTVTAAPDGNLWVGANGRVLRIAVGVCPPGPELCLDGRFRARVDWNSGETSGAATPVALTPNAGYYWFFSPNNVELLLKIVDGRAVNGSYWVFAGSLTNVEFTLTVTDTATGAVRTYRNPQGRLASLADVSAF
ncbi:MAG: hypothetical protein ABI682_10450 [Acidobacteriota bacterium]